MTTRSDIEDFSLVKTHSYSILGIYKIKVKEKLLGWRRNKDVDFVKKIMDFFYEFWCDYYKNYVIWDYAI